METAKKVIATGYAHWANLLINADDQGLSADDHAELATWLQFHQVDAGQCVDCGEEYVGHADYPGALQGLVCDFTFFVEA